MIPIYKPYLSKECLKYAHDALDSTWISSHGKYLILAEEKLKDITKSKYVILTNNGTSATHLVAHSLSYKYPHIKKLLVPSNVYIAAWNMFITTPHYNLIPIDSDINKWNPDYSNIDSFIDETISILIVHNIGNIINVPNLKRKFPNTIFVEDNCEGFLGYYKNIPTGNASLSYSISFFGNKIITSGEGGAFCTNDEDVYNKINKIRAHGITSEKFVFSNLGYNYRMTNIQAAILYGQLNDLNTILKKKKNVFDTYHKELKHDKIFFPEKEKDVINSNWMLGIRIDITEEEMNKLKLHLHYNDIETRPMFPPINYHSHFKKFGDNFPNSKKLYESSVILPSYPELTKYEIKYISKTIKNFLNNNL